MVIIVPRKIILDEAQRLFRLERLAIGVIDYPGGEDENALLEELEHVVFARLILLYHKEKFLLNRCEEI